MFEMMRKAKRAIPGLAALALVLALGASAPAGPSFTLPKGSLPAPKAKAETSIVGVWATKTTVNGQEVILCLALAKDGSWAMAILDGEGKVLKQIVGRYTYSDNSLALEMDGKPFGTFQVTSVSPDEFIVNGTERWQRVEA